VPEPDGQATILELMAAGAAASRRDQLNDDDLRQLVRDAMAGVPWADSKARHPDILDAALESWKGEITRLASDYTSRWCDL
jgi:hypothetical protein